MKLLELEVNKKNYIITLILCIAFVVIVIGLYYVSLLTYKTFKLEDDTIVANFGEQNMNVHIDSLKPEGNKVEIYGWAYKENEKIKTINCNYVLKNSETEEMYIVRTRHEENTNVPEEYSNSGIHTRFITKNLKAGKYYIYVLYKNNNNNILAETGIHLDII